MKNRLIFAFDNNLSLLYRNIRLRGGRLLAIKFTYRGKRFEVDTPEEATALLAHLEKEETINVEQGLMSREELLYEKTKWTADRFMDLVQNIGRQQQIFLAAMMEYPHPVRSDVVGRRIRAHSSMVLSGIQSGLAKQVRAIGLEPSDLYRVQISWTEGERKRFLTLDEGFRLVAADNDWPPKNIRDALEKVKK